MLELRNITKVYRAKSGVSVTALNDVSITFPETGMIFLLGKSGSGKSTLLNVMGGLDSFDSGELIIKGKSSRDFKGSDFDAYRNTFIGFIFQEYNILEDFTVGANIGLALELQGQKATSEAINAILSQVDLDGYGSRKPSELSGGQKQRIAIARALIKNPEIIMADEPTGALDSDTGRQVFDTLKNLSKSKLVIVVSHDRDFAEKYGDRIIELSDGVIISDDTLETGAVREDPDICCVGDDYIRIRQGYRLTAEDLQMINDYLKRAKRDVILSTDERVISDAKEVAEATGVGTVRAKRPTGSVASHSYDAAQTKFIKSRLPLKAAFRMGANGLKKAPVRLVFTILLSVIAFVLFGFSDTMAAYNKTVSAVNSIRDSQIQNATFVLYMHDRYNYYENGELSDVSHQYYRTDALNAEDLAYLKEQTGIDFKPVYTGSTSTDSNFNLSSMILDASKQNNRNGYSLFDGKSYGFTELTDADLSSLGFSISGRLPENTSEIAIPEFLYQYFRVCGMQADGVRAAVDPDTLTMDDAPTTGILGRTISVNINGTDTAFTVTGVVDTHFDYERYNAFKWDNTDTEPMNALLLMAMEGELNNVRQFGYHALLFGCQGLIDTLPAPSQNNYDQPIGLSFFNSSVTFLFSQTDGEEPITYFPSYFLPSTDLPSGFHSVYPTGVSSLPAGSVLLPLDWYMQGSLSYGNPLHLAPLFSMEELAPELVGDPNIDFETLTVNSLITDYFWHASLLGVDPEEYLEGLTDRINAQFGFSFTSDDYTALANNWSLNFTEEPSFETVSYMLALRHLNSLDRDAAYENPAFQNYIAGMDFTGIPDADLPRYYLPHLLNFILEGRYNRDWVSPFDGTTYYELYQTGMAELLAPTIVAGTEFSYEIVSYETGTTSTGNRLTFGGFYYTDPSVPSNSVSNLIISDDLYQKAVDMRTNSDFYSEQIYGQHNSGKYGFVIAPMPLNDNAALTKLVELSYADGENYVFRMQNAVMDTLTNFNDFIESGTKIFLYIGIGFAVFASLMMMNFISASVTQKKREIGILRAVGARSSDVFSVFFSEAFIVALINFALSVGGTILAVNIVNRVFRSELSLLITLLNFSIRQVLLILGISLLVAFLGSLIPTDKIARKKPVDAIRDR